MQAVVEQGADAFADVVAGVEAGVEVSLFDAVRVQKVLAEKSAGIEASERMPASPITSPSPMRPASNELPSRLRVTETTPDSMMNR